MTTTGELCAQKGPVDKILAGVHKRIGTQKFNAWFKNGALVSVADGCIKVVAANPFVAGWIESHFADCLTASAREATGRKLRLMVSVDPVLSGRLRKRQLDVQAEMVARHTSGRVRRGPSVATCLRYKLGDFVVGSSNRLAHAAATAVAGGGKPKFNPLFIHGPCGVGKTHLLQGICNAVARARGRGRVGWKYITAEQFTNEFVQAVRRKKVDGFRKAYRHLDVLAIDDVHFLAAKKATQDEFLHTFNSIESAGKQVVMASDAHPHLVGQFNPQLVSRFVAGMVVKIDPPDRDTRMAILRMRARRMKLAAGEKVLEYQTYFVSTQHTSY